MLPWNVLPWNVLPWTVLPWVVLPWVVLALGLVLATAPAWRLALGFNPGLDDLLQLRCLPGR